MPRSDILLSKKEAMKNSKLLTNSIRIIGGKWRGKKLSFLGDSSVRPTLDRIRETLFNWLQPVIADSRCLDAFTGSGALGMEALSRGAGHVTFVDNDGATLAHLRGQLQTLGVSNHDNVRLSLPEGLSQIRSPAYDIIFLDPPFNTDILDRTLEALANSPLVKPGTLVYFETSARHEFNLEGPWRAIKHQHTKRLAYGLLEFSA